MKARGKPWSFSECYFAVWIYDRLDQDRGLVKQTLYNEVSLTVRRSPKSVEWKVQNVSSCDPRPRIEKPISEAPSVQKRLRDVYNWFWKDPQSARQLYELFHQELIFGEQNIFGAPKDILEHKPKVMMDRHSIIFEEAEIYITEGMPSTICIKSKARSLELVEEGRKYFKNREPNRELRCYACNYTRPDTMEREIVQLHHSRPLSEYDKRGETIKISEAIQNLAPLCPTCHRIAHTDSPPLSVPDIKSVILQ